MFALLRRIIKDYERLYVLSHFKVIYQIEDIA